MTTNYPAALDSFTNPTATDELDDEIGTRTHSEFHADNNDAIEAIQAELGTDPKGAAASVKARIAATETVANAALPTATAATTYQPLDTDLTAIAALTSAADKAPYSTGAGTWALADFTAAGRALVDDADASAQRTTLGLGTMAVATATDYVAKSLFDANTVLYATTDNTPVALTVGASTIVGRKATGDISALSVAESKTLLAIDHGADLAGLSDDDHTQYVLVAGTRSGAQVVLQAGNAAHIPLIAKGAAAQSSGLQQWQNSAGTVLASVSAAGNLGAASVAVGSGSMTGSYIQNSTGTDSYIEMGTSVVVLNRTSASNIALATKGMAAQSGNLHTWFNSAWATLASVSAAGLGSFAGVTLPGSTDRLKFGHADQAQTTVGAAGGASALPATPTKYFKVKDSGGTEYVIPAYAAA